jgi:membrane associated rhomboid family serine protease
MPPIRNAATGLAILTVIASIIWAVLAEQGITLYLIPGYVLRGQLWQLITFIPASIGTWAVLFTALIIWTTGGSLESYWGKRHFLLFCTVIPFLTGVITVALAFVFPQLLGVPLQGGSLLFSIIWVGFGCVIWNGQTNVWGYPVSGRTFAMLGVLVAALNGVFSGLAVIVPEAIALSLTFAHARFRFPTRQLEAFGSWRLQRDLKKRSAHLRAVSSDQRNMPNDSDRYLH